MILQHSQTITSFSFKTLLSNPSSNKIFINSKPQILFSFIFLINRVYQPCEFLSIMEDVVLLLIEGVLFYAFVRVFILIFCLGQCDLEGLWIDLLNNFIYSKNYITHQKCLHCQICKVQHLIWFMEELKS